MYDCLGPYDFKVTYNPSLLGGSEAIYRARVSGFLNGTGNELNSDQIQYKNGQLEITEKIKLEGMETPEGNDIKEGWQASTVEGWRFYVPFRISWKYMFQIPNDLAVENLTASAQRYKPGDKLVFEWDFVNHGQWGITGSNPEVMAQVFINGKQVNSWKIEELAGRNRLINSAGETSWSEPVREHLSYGYDVPKTGAPDKITFEVRINDPQGEMKESTDYNNRAQVEVEGIQNIKPPKVGLECNAEVMIVGVSSNIKGRVTNPNPFDVIVHYTMEVNGESIKTSQGVMKAGETIPVKVPWKVPEDMPEGTVINMILKAEITEKAEEPPSRWLSGNIQNPAYDQYVKTHEYDKKASAWHYTDSKWASGSAWCKKSAVLPDEIAPDYELTPSIIVD